MPENMIQQTELPQIHLIRDTDLGVFAYELHILAGDFLRESEFNLRTLATNTGVDSIAIMGKRHMWLSDAVFAYCSTGIYARWPSRQNISGQMPFCSMQTGKRTAIYTATS
ncbi:MAG: hypothetical protein V8S75_00770 [[Ruminococcus] torques]